VTPETVFSALLQRYVEQQMRRVHAVETILAVRVLAQHPWCWGIIGFNDFCERQR
jgi:hypothetical protein